MRATTSRMERRTPTAPARAPMPGTFSRSSRRKPWGSPPSNTCTTPMGTLWRPVRRSPELGRSVLRTGETGLRPTPAPRAWGPSCPSATAPRARAQMSAAWSPTRRRSSQPKATMACFMRICPGNANTRSTPPVSARKSRTLGRMAVVHRVQPTPKMGRPGLRTATATGSTATWAPQTTPTAAIRPASLRRKRSSRGSPTGYRGLPRRSSRRRATPMCMISTVAST
jgi:hypothetical protein